MLRIDYYIYYQIGADRGADLETAVQALQADIAELTGIEGRFRRRLDDASTWMEIYEGVTDQLQFEVELGSAVMRHGLNDFLLPDTVRHMERFRLP